MPKKCVIIIPIYHPDWKWSACLQILKKQKDIQFDLYIVDSGSEIHTYEKDLVGLSYRIVKTTPKQFNHGRTRQEAAVACKDYSILIYMTQDAIPANEYAISRLVNVFENPQVGCAYGRQLPHKNASVLAARARAFNYPENSRLKSLADVKELGIKVPFISDTFAAYRTEALFKVGGFPDDVILSEDTYVAAKMVLAGWYNAYCAEAQVYHSHNYTILQEFRRYFDTGAFHAMEPWIREAFGRAEGEGLRLVINELKYLFKHKPYLLPSAIIRDGCKFMGYRMGMKYKEIPINIRKKCSMMSTFWK